MSRLTKEEHDEILKGILGDGDLTPEMEDFMDRLRKDFDESLIVDEKEADEDVENKGDTEADRKFIKTLVMKYLYNTRRG